jgi:hypothetical protein
MRPALQPQRGDNHRADGALQGELGVRRQGRHKCVSGAPLANNKAAGWQAKRGQQGGVQDQGQAHETSLQAQAWSQHNFLCQPLPCIPSPHHHPCRAKKCVRSPRAASGVQSGLTPRQSGIGCSLDQSQRTFLSPPPPHTHKPTLTTADIALDAIPPLHPLFPPLLTHTW